MSCLFHYYSIILKLLFIRKIIIHWIFEVVLQDLFIYSSLNFCFFHCFFLLNISFFFQRLALFKLFLELWRSKTKRLKEKSFFLGKLSRLVVTFFFLSKKKFSGISFLTPVLHLILYYISLFTIFFTFLHFNLCVIIYFTFLFIKRYNISWTVWLAMIFHTVTDRS